MTKKIDNYMLNKFNEKLSTDEYEIIDIDKEKEIITYKHLVCGTIITKNRESFRKRPFCNNNACVQERKKKTNLEKYGCESHNQVKCVKEKKRQVFLERYGVETPGQLEEFKEKIKQTNLKKYGCENVFQNEAIKEKSKKTLLKKYGVENISQLDDIKEKKVQTCLENHGVKAGFNLFDKVKQTNLEKYGTEFACQNEEVKEKTLKTRSILFYENKVLKFKHVKPLFEQKDYITSDYKNLYPWKCNKCDTEFKDHLYSGHLPRCPKCYPVNYNNSKQETEIADWLNISSENRNKRYYYNYPHFYELDMLSSEHNLGIELNGVFWHSEIKGEKDKNYHLNKTNYFLEQGIQILHIWDCEWIEKQEIVKSIINSKIGKNENCIFARKTEIKEVSSAKSIDFLNHNHIQGNINSSIKLGLYYDDELVSILTLGKSRFNKSYTWEIHRFCNKLNTSVVGGFSKLLKYFTNNYSGNIITYADRRYSTGGLYKNNGFKLLRISEPNYFYTQNYHNFESRNKYQKHKLSQLLENYSEDLTEWENMQMNGYDRIWDCGNYVFVLER